MRPWLALYAASALAAPAPAGLGSGVTDKFEVLDLSVAKGWAVVKVVDHTDDFGDGYATGSVDCQYAGMSAQPRSGVTLATWDLGGGQIGEAFVVYAKVSDTAECMPPETSTKNLADAKAAATAKGLDVTRKPAPVLPKGGSFALTVDGQGVTVVATNGVRSNDDDMERVAWAKLAVGGTTLYEIEKSFSPMGAGHMSLEFTHAYVDGGKVVFAIREVEGNMRMADSTSWALSPPLAPGG